MICGIDHIVIAVNDIEHGIETWRDKLGIALSHRANHPDAGLEIAFFCLDDGTFLELVSPTSDQSPLNEFLQDKGEGVHLLSLQVDDLDRTVADLLEKGVALDGVGSPRVVIRPESASGIPIQLWPKGRPHKWRDGETRPAPTGGE